jgi:hypothetical protein
MDKLVVIINGVGGSGKDTLCKVICKHYKAIVVSSIKPIKEIAFQHGWNGDKDPRSRRFLSELKRVFSDYNDLPNRYLLSEYNKFINSNNDIMFAHIRESDQIDKFKNSIKGKCVTLLVRKSIESVNENSFGNSSDDNVMNYEYDYVYKNDKLLSEVEDDFLKFFQIVIEEAMA